MTRICYFENRNSVSNPYQTKTKQTLEGLNFKTIYFFNRLKFYTQRIKKRRVYFKPNLKVGILKDKFKLKKFLSL